MTASPHASNAHIRVLEGVRVLEVSHFAYVPSAGAVLADWGAEVVKVENPAHGDPMRGVAIGGISPGTGGFTFMWELANRGKRSVGIDLSTPRGREVLLTLARECDVFLTSFLPSVRVKLRLTEDDLREVNPSIVYAAGTGHGSYGPEIEIGGFDQTSFWYRAGVASALTPSGGRPPDLPGPGFGDVTSGMALAGGVAAALFHRQRTGEGLLVDGSLLATGMWAMQPSIVASNTTGAEEFRFPDRLEASNPLVNTFRTSDDRFVGLCVIKADKHWAELCSAVGHEELIEDTRFRTQDERATNSAECVRILDAIFEREPLSHWEEVLSTQGAQWAAIQRVSDLSQDPQVIANGYLQTVDYGNGRDLELVPSPIQHGGAAPDLLPAPELGANTEEVLLQAGIDWDLIAELKSDGVIT